MKTLSNEQVLELLKASITTSLEGLVSPQQVSEFIDMTVEQTAILQQLRVETDIKKSLELYPIDLGDPAMVLATEATVPAAADVIQPTITKKTLTPVEVLSAFDVSFSYLRKNIRGESVNDDLNRIFAKRMGKDIVMTAFRGNTAAANDTRKNKALRCRNGFVVKALADAAVHDYSIGSVDYAGVVFPGLLDLMPADYRDQRDELGIFCSANVRDKYALQIGARATAGGDSVLFGGGANRAPMRFLDIDLLPVYGMAHDDSEYIILTLKKNLAIGFGVNMEIGRDITQRSRLLEVTITSEWDNAILIGDALVLGSPA